MTFHKLPTRRLTMIFCAAVLLALCASAYGKIIAGVEDWGLGGSVKSGMWSPLYLELESKGEDFCGWLKAVVDADQQTKPIFVQPVELIADTPSRFWIYVRTPPSNYRTAGWKFSWELVDNKDRAVVRSKWRSPKILTSSESVVAVIRSPGIGGARLGAVTEQDSDAALHVRYVIPATAPSRWIGYQSADALVWLNPEPDKMELAAQRDAVVKYVQNGGHLILAAGADWQPMAKSFLRELLPADIAGSQTLGRLNALDEFGAGSVKDHAIVTLILNNPRGDVLMRQREQPVIVRGTIGLGRVTLIGFDPTQAPFTKLTGYRDFWARMLQARITPKMAAHSGAAALASNPLILSLNDFPDFKPINFFFVGVFLFVYVILIGPVDYFVLKRLKKLHWTWLTFPAIAVASSLIAFLLLSSGRVAGFHANSVSVVNASADARHISGHTVLTMLSPKQKEYPVALENAIGAIAPREFQVLGGAGGGFSSTPCLVPSPGTVIEQMLVRVWDAQTLQAQWAAAAPELPEVLIKTGGPRFSGTVKNNTPYDLGDACLIHRNLVLKLGDLRRDASVDLQKFQPIELPEYLKSITPRRFAQMQYRGWHGERLNRDTADAAARWLSLFAYVESCPPPKPGEDADTVKPLPGDGHFARTVYLKDEYDNNMNIAFDLPAAMQLGDISSGREAVLLFWVKRSFAEIKVAGLSADWERSLVRLRVPVADVRPAATGDQP